MSLDFNTSLEFNRVPDIIGLEENSMCHLFNALDLLAIQSIIEDE